MTIKIEPGTRRVLYQYKYNEGTGDEIDMEYDLLCEVGQPWVQSFKNEIEARGLKIELYDGTDGYYERLAE